MYLSNNFVTNYSTVIFLSLIFLSGCGGGGGSSSPSPGVTEVSTSSSQLISSQPTSTSQKWNLDAAFDYGMADGMFTQQITVIENGQVLRSAYRDIGAEEIIALEDASQTILIPAFQGVRENSQVTSWSVGKSILSIIAGIAQDQGFLNIDDKASEYITEWVNDERNEITIRHLLNMRSGLQLPPENSEEGGGITNFYDQQQLCLDRNLTGEINEIFEYNNCNSQVIGEIIKRATAQNFKAYADVNLFGPLGINAEWWTDVRNNYITYCCVDMTQEEFGRFGMMLLNKGEGIVSEEYINEIFTPEFYNLHFWFIDDTVQAIGFDGQFIVIDFNNDLVILRNSLYYPLHSGDYILCIGGNFICGNSSTGPVTLPEALLGVRSEFSISEFLRILKTP